MPIKILFFDNCHMIKIGFQQILKNYSSTEFETILWNNSDNEVNKAIAYYNPDILIINLDTIKNDIADKTFSYINKNNKNLKIILLSTFMTQFTFEAFSFKGILGFLHTNSKEVDIMNCIQNVQNGHKFMSGTLKKEINKNLNITEFVRNSLSCLTKKELEIIKFIIDKKTSKEIAIVLNNSSRTIETHRRSIAEKFDITGQGKLTLFLIENRKLVLETLKAYRKLAVLKMGSTIKCEN